MRQTVRVAHDAAATYIEKIKVQRNQTKQNETTRNEIKYKSRNILVIPFEFFTECLAPLLRRLAWRRKVKHKEVEHATSVQRSIVVPVIAQLFLEKKRTRGRDCVFFFDTSIY